MAEAVSQTGGTLLDKIVDIIIPPQIVAFLNTTLIRVPYFVLNYWSFVHFFAGVLFFLLISRSIKVWFVLNIIFEVVEFLLALGGNPLFVEEFVDIFWDILFSMFGFWVMSKLLPNLSEKQASGINILGGLKDFITKKINR